MFRLFSVVLEEHILVVVTNLQRHLVAVGDIYSLVSPTLEKKIAIYRPENTTDNRRWGIFVKGCWSNYPV